MRKALAALTAVSAFLVVQPAQAYSPAYDFAEALANLIVSEELCGLSFDQVAIETLIEAKVAADDLDFNTDLETLLYVAQNQPAPSGSALTVRCAQARRVAVSFGLMRE